LGFSLNTFLSTVLKAGNQNIDTLVLGLVIDIRLVGIYALFRQFLAPLAFLSNPFATLVYPKFVNAVVERRQSEIKNSIHGVNDKLLKFYLVALLIIVPLLIGYGVWMKLDLQWEEYLSFVMMMGSSILSGLIWWARPFSNAINPRYSLQGNFFATLFLLVFLYPATLFAGVQGTAAVMFILGVGNTLFWKKKLINL
jgi:O-antigen/teichoic acid export membrane protein